LLKPFLFFDDFKSDEGGTTSAILILVVAILLSRGERERDNNARGGSLRCFEEFRKLFFPRYKFLYLAREVERERERERESKRETERE
jgi:hypothetical protein